MKVKTKTTVVCAGCLRNPCSCCRPCSQGKHDKHTYDFWKDGHGVRLCRCTQCYTPGK